MDVSAQFLMLTPDERARLKCFCDVCDSITTCRFVREFHLQSHHIFIGKLPDGRVVNEYPRYDDDDLRAFFTHYRKLRLAQEPTNLFAIMNLLKWKGNESDRKIFDAFKNEIKAEGRSWWGATLPDENGDRVPVTQEDLERLILYGDVFHWSTEERATLKRVLGNSSIPKAIAFFNYLRFAWTVVGYARRTADLIRQRGYVA